MLPNLTETYFKNNKLFTQKDYIFCKYIQKLNNK